MKPVSKKNNSNLSITLIFYAIAIVVGAFIFYILQVIFLSYKPLWLINFSTQPLILGKYVRLNYIGFFIPLITSLVFLYFIIKNKLYSRLWNKKLVISKEFENLITFGFFLFLIILVTLLSFIPGVVSEVNGIVTGSYPFLFFMLFYPVLFIFLNRDFQEDPKPLILLFYIVGFLAGAVSDIVSWKVGGVFGGAAFLDGDFTFPLLNSIVIYITWFLFFKNKKVNLRS